jgi:hypothetical protein
MEYGCKNCGGKYDTDDFVFICNDNYFEKYIEKQYKWCNLCKFIGWINGNDKIDNFSQLKINGQSDIRIEWIPYNQFNKIRNIGNGDFIKVYSATWGYEVALICFNDSQRLLNKVRKIFNLNLNILLISKIYLI